MKIEKKHIIEKIKTCFDPEIPIDLWNLGLIYDIKIEEVEEKQKVEILMTLTTPGCSMIDIIAQDLKNKIEEIEKIGTVKINVTFDPPWEPEMMKQEGKEKLGFAKPKEEKKDINWE